MFDWLRTELERKRRYQEAKLKLESLGHDDLAQELEARRESEFGGKNDG